MTTFYADGGGGDDDIGNLDCYREGPVKDYPPTIAEWNTVESEYYQWDLVVVFEINFFLGGRLSILLS